MEYFWSALRNAMMGASGIKTAIPQIREALSDPKRRAQIAEEGVRFAAELGRRRALGFLREVLTRLEQEGREGTPREGR